MIFLKHTHQSTWRICTLCRAPSPGARQRPARVRPETGRRHPPFSAQQNRLYSHCFNHCAAAHWCAMKSV